MHLIRNSLDFASWKERKALAAGLRPIYMAANAEAAEAELTAFEQGPWGEKFPTIVAIWRRAWSHVIPYFAFPPAVRRVIYTTNSIESVHARLRKIIKTRGHFPNDMMPPPSSSGSLCVTLLRIGAVPLMIGSVDGRPSVVNNNSGSQSYGGGFDRQQGSV